MIHPSVASRVLAPGLVTALSLAACVGPPEQEGELAPLLPATGQTVPGSYMVGLREEAAHLGMEVSLTGRDARPSVAVVADELGSLPGVHLVGAAGHAVRVMVVEADDEGLARLRADPRVAYVEPDTYGTPASVQTTTSWGLDRIDQPRQPLDGRYYYNSPSPAPNLYIIDTGVRATHTEFTGRIGTGVAFDGSSPWDDCGGHGTSVAAIAAGRTYGVAKNAIIHSVKLARLLNGSCATSASYAALALDWVAAHRTGFSVANISWQVIASPTIDAAARGLIASGVPLVTAAGNMGANPGFDPCDFSPSGVAEVITVGATDRNDARWLEAGQGSGAGKCLDLFAPGVAIRTAGGGGDSSLVDKTGTSFAAPFVAGAIARYFADKPGYTPAGIACVAFGGPAGVCPTTSGAATVGVVVNRGTDSPDKLLFIPGVAPRITGFTCPVSGDSGANQYTCTVAYASDAPVSIAWSGGGAGSSVTALCATGTTVRKTVSVSNNFGSDSRTATFPCPTNPLP